MARKDLRPNTLPWRVGKSVLSAFFRGYLNLHVYGEDNVPSTGPLLLVSNHVSYLDPLAIGVACHREVNFIGKREVFRIPVVSYFIRQWGAIPIDRKATDTTAVRAAVRVIREGKILGIFPEGTRSTDGRLQTFREGAAKMALRFGLPILPVAVLGTHAVMPRGARLPRRVPVVVRFGQPFELAGSSRGPMTPPALQAAAEEIRERIAALFDEEK